MAHSHAKLADAKAHPPKQQYDLGLGIILRIPMRECENDLSVGGTEAAGAIGHVHAHQRPDDPAEHETAEAPNK